MKKLISIVLFAVWCGGVLSGQETKRPESYNYWRGQEALQNDDVAEALDFFEKDVQDNPKNGYSYSWLAYLWYKTEEYGRDSVVRNQKAPLLLGQSVLNRLGKIEIDNKKSLIRISKIK